MSRFKRLSVSFAFLCFSLLLIPASPALAQESSDAMAAQEELKAGIDAAAFAANNGFMLVCCALVLFMTAPGLAMFYGGLVRRKNVLSVMMQCVFLMGLMTVIWAIYGYSLAFGGSGGWIGNTEYLFMNGVQRYWDESTNSVVTPIAGGIAIQTHMLFQGMFFIIYAGVDLWGIRRTDEVQRDGRLLSPVGHLRLLSAMSLGMGWWTAVLWCRQHCRRGA